MPSQTTSISDLTCQLGLRAPYTKKREDWALSPVVHDLYVKEINELLSRYTHDCNEDIRASSDLSSDVVDLLLQYGSRIWPPPLVARPWLFAVGEPEDKQHLYPRNLYFNEAKDRKLYVPAVCESVCTATVPLTRPGSRRLFTS